MLFSSLFCDSASSDNFSGHPGVERCPFLRNINGATTIPFSSALPVAPRGGKGPIFEDGPGFESALEAAFEVLRRSYVPDENRSENTDVKPEPALPFNPLPARAATISLSAFGPSGFNLFNGKGKKQNKKPNKPDQNSMKQKGGNPPSHEALSDEWLENGQCPLARSYRAMSGVLPLVAKALQPPAGMKLKCPSAIVAARAAPACTTLVKALCPQPLPSKMVAIAMLGMAANVPLGVWREHTKKFSPQWFTAVNAAVPFITILRKSVNMVFTIAASILGQTIGSMAERIRLKALAAKTAAGPATIDAAMYSDIASTSRRPPSNVSRFKPFKRPQSKVTAASKASVKNVSLNVSRCSGVTFNFNSGAANTKFSGQQADKRKKSTQ